MGDKYYGHTIGRFVEEINIEPLARTYDETSLHPVYASDSISDSNISHPDTTVKNNYMHNSRNNTAEVSKST